MKNDENEQTIDALILEHTNSQKTHSMKDSFVEGYEKAEQDIVEYLHKKIKELGYSSQAQSMKIDLLVIIDSIKQGFHRTNGFPTGHRSLID